MSVRNRRAALRTLFLALRDRPLDYANSDDREFYARLHDPDHDPIERLYDTIDYSEQASFQLISGSRGTGKTTEFSRLAARLREADHLVVRVELKDYVDMTSPVHISDFLLVMLGALGDALAAQGLLDAGSKLGDFWDTACAFISKTRAEAKELTLKLGAVSMKVGLTSDKTLRQAVRAALEGRLAETVGLVRDHHRKLIAALMAKWGPDARLVVIFDSLEHLRGTRDDWEKVQHSVDELLLTHGRYLELPDTHVVMSVPAFIALKAESLEERLLNGRVWTWSACRVRSADGDLDADAVDRMVELVKRRGDWQLILPDRSALEKLVLASGGYLRDLLAMLVEAVHQAKTGPAPDAARRIIEVSRNAYLPLYADEIDVLRRIAESRSLRDVTSEERRYVSQFLDSHLLLAYVNDRAWYDIHPLVRDEVLKR